MASIRREVNVSVAADAAWDAIRDVGALHTRLVKGFVTDCRMDGSDARVVTFANGMVARELIVDVNEEGRRLAWSAVGGRLTHYSASVQVFTDGEGRCRLVWIADLLPHDMAPAIATMIDHGMSAMRRTLEGAA
jgi:hypothetical protein